MTVTVVVAVMVVTHRPGLGDDEEAGGTPPTVVGLVWITLAFTKWCWVGAAALVNSIDTWVPSELTWGVPAVKLVPMAVAISVVGSTVPSASTVKPSVPTPGSVTVIAPGAEPLTAGRHLAV